MNRRKNTPNSTKINNFQKNKKVASMGESKKQNKGIQCRECERFGHIQSESANTLKKKEKSLKTTWSDENSDGSEKEDDYMSNYIAFQVTSKKNGSTSVMPDVATSKTTKSNIDVATTNDSESDPNNSEDYGADQRERSDEESNSQL